MKKKTDESERERERRRLYRRYIQRERGMETDGGSAKEREGKRGDRDRDGKDRERDGNRWIER